MKFKTLAVVCAVALGGVAQANAIDALTPTVRGDIGDNSKYQFNSNLNYMYSFHGDNTGFQNSDARLNLSTDLTGGSDVLLSVGVDADKKVLEDKYRSDVFTQLDFKMDQHNLYVGYDKFLSRTIFQNAVSNNIDTNFSENAIGSTMTKREGYTGYDFTYQNVVAGAGVDFDGNIFGKASIFAFDTDFDAIIYDRDDLEMFVSAGFDLGDDTNLSVGMGSVNKRFTSMVSASHFVYDNVSLYGNITAVDKDSDAVIGADYALGNLSFYVETGFDVHKKNKLDKNGEAVVMGVKFKV